MAIGTVKRKVCIESSRGTCCTRYIGRLCCAVEKCTEQRSLRNELSLQILLLSGDSMVSVRLSPSRFTTLCVCSSVALTFLDVLDLLHHRYRQRSWTFSGHVSCLASRTWVHPIFYNLPTKRCNSQLLMLRPMADLLARSRCRPLGHASPQTSPISHHHQRTPGWTPPPSGLVRNLLPSKALKNW